MRWRKPCEDRLVVAEAALAEIDRALQRIPPDAVTDAILDMDVAIGAWRRGFIVNADQ